MQKNDLDLRPGAVFQSKEDPEVYAVIKYVDEDLVVFRAFILKDLVDVTGAAHGHGSIPKSEFAEKYTATKVFRLK
jgi:hypothetical protein